MLTLLRVNRGDAWLSNAEARLSGDGELMFLRFCNAFRAVAAAHAHRAGLDYPCGRTESVVATRLGGAAALARDYGEELVIWRLPSVS